jgi:hypothetical protein
MKNIILTLLALNLCAMLMAQDFDKNIASARSAYSSGNLEDARFAMQQLLQELDITIGQEVLKKLPTKMDAMPVNEKNDNVTANTGLAGVLIHRDYGTAEKTADLDIMNNSPLIASLNAILSLPFVGNASDGSQKVVKVNGYKGVLHKYENTDTNTASYDVQIPFGSTLLTLKVENTTEADILKMANTIPLADIAKMVQ